MEIIGEEAVNQRWDKKQKTPVKKQKVMSLATRKRTTRRIGGLLLL
tara:strand:- start:409 stop:546 length:138 start_codon:yes stop_codon:yes gene_type:complete